MADALPPEEEWKVFNSVEAAKTATALFAHRHPKELLSIYFDPPTPREPLRALASAVKESGYEGELSMELWHENQNFVSCDEFVKELKGAR